MTLINSKNTHFEGGQLKANPSVEIFDLEIDTSLSNNKNEKARKFKLIDEKNSFNIQSFNLPEIIYIKSFKIESTEKEVKSNFIISDKTKKYVLFAYKERKNDKLDILINNVPQINALDFSNDNIVIKPILLIQNNEISVKYSGNKNDNIFVSIVQKLKLKL